MSAKRKMQRLLGRQVQLEHRDLRVCASIPATDHLHTEFHRSFVNLLLHSHAQGLLVGQQIAQYTLIHYARQFLAESALRHDWTHVLFLDSDMTFPADTAVRLVRHGKSIVGANYPRRYRPHTMTATAGDGSELRTSGDSTGLEKVGSVGTGCLLVSCGVFRALDRPWFDAPWLDTEKVIGEDFYFCAKARAAGLELFVDHDLSREVRHIGVAHYGNEHREGILHARAD